MTAVETPTVVARMGVRLRSVDGDAERLLGLALRRNPRRAQLLVSRVLGKHVPTDPRLVRGAGLLLGGLVADALAGRAPRALPTALLHAAIDGAPGAAAALHEAALHGAALHGDPAPDVLVLGYAETATGLGHCVAEGLGGTDYLHSTRRPVPGATAAGGFSEEHSHATEHLLLPADPALVRGGRPLVLVDDELSTGRTVLNTIRALHAVAPREQYAVAALVDVREGTELVDGVAALGARIDVVALCRAQVELPADLAERAAALRSGRPELEAVATAPVDPPVVALPVPAGLPAGARHGFGREKHAALATALPAAAATVAQRAGLRTGERVLVLGTEELMALPLRLAQTLADAGHDVRFSTTTRSPAVVVDEPDYALRNGVAFPAHDDPADGPGPRFAYNIAPVDGAPPWDHVLVVVDPPADTPALRTGLLAALAPHTRRTTVVITP